MKDKRTAANLRDDPTKHAAYLERKRRERKARVGYEARRKAQWRAENPGHNEILRKAHHAVEAALATGKLVRPSICLRCMIACTPEAHHGSYAPEKFLDVQWLCAKCHAIADGRSV